MGRPKQRKTKHTFHGNRFTRVSEAVAQSPVERRFSVMKEASSSSVNDVESGFHSIVVDNGFLDKFAKKLECESCSATSCSWKLTSQYGFASKVRIYCSECDAIVLESFTSCRKDFGNVHMLDGDAKSNDEHESAIAEENSSAVVQTCDTQRPYFLNSRIVFAAQKTGIHMERLNEFFNL